jgi:hypothetical protein
MKPIGKFLYFIGFIYLVTFTSCQKDDIPELESHILFSVDLDNLKFDPYYREAYMAAYTSDGILINYGSLSDSAKWVLKGKCKEDKIDILYFEIYDEGSLTVNHFRNVSIGQLFADTNTIVFPSPEYYNITLKVEDFGNHRDNNTSLTFFESSPHRFTRGSGYSGEFDWEKIENGYAYKTSYIELDPRYQGAELLIFERGTNEPYIYNLDIPASDHNPGDTITLNKNDFTKGELKTLQVVSPDDVFDNIFLFTFNSIDGKRDLLTSYDQVIPNVSGEKCMKYVLNDALPMNFWNFNYFPSTWGSTSYSIRSNKEMPSSIEIKQLTGHRISKSGNNYSFTHGNIFPDKNLVRSSITFSKGACSTLRYKLYFDASESIGNTTITPFDIPYEIVAKYADILETNSTEWNTSNYSQIYTNIDGNSPLEFLQNSLLNWNDNNSSTNDYTYEEFTTNL